MIMKSLTILAAVTALAAATVADAATLTTSLTAGNSNNGIMFDITSGANSLTIHSLDSVMSSAGTFTFEVYTIAGGIGSNLNNPGAWTLIGTLNGITSAGQNSLVTLDFADFSLPANSTAGLYYSINSSDQGDFRIGYNNGSVVGGVVASDGDLTILTGYGRQYPFATTFQPRNFAGSINYSVGAVPEPQSWALLIAGFGLVGAAMRRRQTAAKYA